MYDQQKVVAMLYLFYTGSPYMYCKIGQRNFYRLCVGHITFVAFNFGKFRKIYSYLENIGGGAVAPSCPPLAGTTAVDENVSKIALKVGIFACFDAKLTLRA